jgi:hypothetical protein
MISRYVSYVETATNALHRREHCCGLHATIRMTYRGSPACSRHLIPSYTCFFASLALFMPASGVHGTVVYGMNRIDGSDAAILVLLLPLTLARTSRNSLVPSASPSSRVKHLCWSPSENSAVASPFKRELRSVFAPHV